MGHLLHLRASPRTTFSLCIRIHKKTWSVLNFVVHASLKNTTNAMQRAVALAIISADVFARKAWTAIRHFYLCTYFLFRTSPNRAATLPLTSDRNVQLRYGAATRNDETQNPNSLRYLTATNHWQSRFTRVCPLARCMVYHLRSTKRNIPTLSYVERLSNQTPW